MPKKRVHQSTQIAHKGHQKAKDIYFQSTSQSNKSNIDVGMFEDIYFQVSTILHLRLVKINLLHFSI